MSRTTEEDPKAEDRGAFSKTVIEDLQRGDLGRTLQQDLKEIYQFYLDDDTRTELASMTRHRRWLHLVYWMVRNSVLKLSPTRRLILLVSVFLFLQGTFGQINLISIVLGFGFLLLILLLELKDKLLAQDELSTGRAVQFALMPKVQPEVAGWDAWLYTEPANDVGGDLVDYQQTRDGRLGIAIGDVAGKGLGAALYMAKLQATLRALTPGYESLSWLGAQVNRIFRRDGLPDRFISLAYLEVSPNSGSVRILNAGHLPPLVIRKGSVIELPKGGAAIGLLPEAEYEEVEVDLGPDDLLVVYSDGVTEARDDLGAFFGRHRLTALLRRMRGLSAEATGLRLLSAIGRFVGDARPSDDLSLVILRRKPVSGLLTESLGVTGSTAAE